MDGGQLAEDIPISISRSHHVIQLTFGMDVTNSSTFFTIGNTESATFNVTNEIHSKKIDFSLVSILQGSESVICLDGGTA